MAFEYKNSVQFQYIKEWINLDNIQSLTQKGLDAINKKAIDVISLDLDGNDIYFTAKLLESNFTPKLFICEYNSKFIPPMRFQIDYDPNHQWKYDDYFGAALMNFVDLFANFGYRLICCNSHTGANAFFVKQKYAHLFPEIPNDINQIYVSPRTGTYTRFGLPKSPKVVSCVLNKQPPQSQ